MARRVWQVNVGGEEHTVEVERSIWTNAGKIRVDGQVINAWGFRLWTGARRFRVGNKPALLHGTGLFPGEWRLFVDGRPATLGDAGAPSCFMRGRGR